jgi:hypothetical protein
VDNPNNPQCLSKVQQSSRGRDEYMKNKRKQRTRNGICNRRKGVNRPNARQDIQLCYPHHFTLIGAIPATVMRKCTQLYQSSQLRLSQIRGFSILIHFGLSLIWGVPELIHFRQFRSSLIWGHPDSTYSIKSLTITFWTHVGRKHMQTNASRPLKLQ